MRLLKIEWLKLKKYRTFYILMGLFLGIFTVLNVAVNRGAFSIKTPGENGQSLNLISSNYAFPKVYENMAYYFGWCLIFICVLIIINITNDYRYKTQRQHIIDGQSRMDYLHSKVMLILGITFALTILYVFMSIIFGVANGGTNIFNGIGSTLHVSLYTLNYLAISALIALVIKRSGLAIMILLAFLFFEEIIIALLKNFAKMDIGRFFPLDCSDALLVKPLDGVAKMAVGTVSSSDHITMVAMSVVWVSIYYFVARSQIRTADL